MLTLSALLILMIPKLNSQRDFKKVIDIARNKGYYPALNCASFQDEIRIRIYNPWKFLKTIYKSSFSIPLLNI